MNISEIAGMLNSYSQLQSIGAVGGVQGVSGVSGVEGTAAPGGISFAEILEKALERLPQETRTEVEESFDEVLKEAKAASGQNSSYAESESDRTREVNERAQRIAAAAAASDDPLAGNAAANLLLQNYMTSALLQSSLSSNADMTSGLFSQMVTLSSADGSTTGSLSGISSLLGSGALSGGDISSLLGTGALSGDVMSSLSKLNELSSIQKSMLSADEDQTSSLLGTFNDLSSLASLSGFGTGVSNILGLDGLSGLSG